MIGNVPLSLFDQYNLLLSALKKTNNRASPWEGSASSLLNETKQQTGSETVTYTYWEWSQEWS